MKVLVFSKEFYPSGGGTGVVAKQICDYIKETGHDVSVLTSSPSSYEIETLHVNCLPGFWPFCFSLKCKFDDYDLIILNDPVAIYIAGLVFSKSEYEKSIAILHGSEPEFVYKNSNLKNRIYCWKFFFTKGLQNAGHIFSHGNYMKTKIDPFITRNCYKKIKPVYFGYDEKLFFREDRCFDFRANFNLQDCDEVILTVSRVDEKKGFNNKLNIFEKLINEGLSLSWFIIGDGPYLTQLKSMVNLKGLQHRVFFLGKVDRSLLRNYYSGADLFWLLSNYEESFGLVYIEAQATGVPVIGRKKAGVRESIKDSVSGFLVENDEQVEAILRQKKYKLLNKSDIVNFAEGFSNFGTFNKALRDIIGLYKTSR
ncbi:glycosyltransferase family 4 protein [Pseudoalteromonas sp. S4741]|uniref:glycosyltransferase family 4 protein n=1 Tax=Pseudoalteromonas sp. S4741 TaxID=579563 RepID=UPI00110A7DF1|nr:glycosyltransferase family 4 protein [Pseudoalteromonas sp. S4741]TMO22080.1 glycosyltransferase family 1 protein [Pseudoalteromonas sp. S4741]